MDRIGMDMGHFQFRVMTLQLLKVCYEPSILRGFPFETLMTRQPSLCDQLRG